MGENNNFSECRFFPIVSKVIIFKKYFFKAFEKCEGIKISRMIRHEEMYKYRYKKSSFNLKNGVKGNPCLRRKGEFLEDLWALRILIEFYG